MNFYLFVIFLPFASAIFRINRLTRKSIHEDIKKGIGNYCRKKGYYKNNLKYDESKEYGLFKRIQHFVDRLSIHWIAWAKDTRIYKIEYDPRKKVENWAQLGERLAKEADSRIRDNLCMVLWSWDIFACATEDERSILYFAKDHRYLYCAFCNQFEKPKCEDVPADEFATVR